MYYTMRFTTRIHLNKFPSIDFNHVQMHVIKFNYKKHEIVRVFTIGFICIFPITFSANKWVRFAFLVVLILFLAVHPTSLLLCPAYQLPAIFSSLCRCLTASPNKKYLYRPRVPIQLALMTFLYFIASFPKMHN